MKKAVIIGLLLILFVNIGGKASSSVIIPEDAIRFRIIANSNQKKDQETKLAVKEALSEVINPILLHGKTKGQVKTMLEENQSLMETLVSKKLEEEGDMQSFQVEYGMHYFPEKEYQGVTYQEGDYESLVVKLGKGEGDNFWCVLFPPLCLLEGEKTESEKVEYTSLIEEIIESILK